jgi:ATP-dependent exoDNAse (exonuclease V) beta subunit (contains helicase and exonuclease domains)
MEQNRASAPFRIWFMGRGGDGKPIPKGTATQRAARATAAEIARLLTLGASSAARIGDRPLKGSDIAVLVRSHRQGRLIRDELARLGVPSVQQTQDSVFDSREAMEVERVLSAVAEPGREPLIRAALATDMLGVGGEALYRLGEDGPAWEECLLTFLNYHQLWREHGFIRMFRTLLTRAKIAPRLLKFRDGQRRLTNVLHIAELLHEQASRQRIGMEGLLKWLAAARRHAARREARTIEEEEEELRLESDEPLVHVVTIHKSKGLEYSIVFCPFLWDGKLWSDTEEALYFHDPAREYQPCLDFGTAHQDEWREHARREELAENLRFFYVALTRAKCRCYVVWGAINDAETSAPAWFFHSPEKESTSGTLDALARHVKALSDGAMWADLKRCAVSAEGGIQIDCLPETEEVRYQPPREGPSRFVARSFSGTLPVKGHITSFTALTEGKDLEIPDYDAGSCADAAYVPLGTRLDIYSFPRGAQSGSCLHTIFERLDFTCRDRGMLEGLVEQTLAEYGFANEWIPVIADTVERVLATPLDRVLTLRLRDVTPLRRLNELEFHYPLGRLKADELRWLLGRHGIAAATPENDFEHLSFAAVSGGYLRGFIDLVFETDGRFYIVDYKTNWLGAAPEDYHRTRLAAVMSQHAYHLQYLLYTVAVHRYLRLRLTNYDYDVHFGGVFYLFLRGMDPALGSDYGIFRDRPGRTLVDALCAYFATRKDAKPLA